MRKLSIAIGLICLILIALTGCSSQKSTKSSVDKANRVKLTDQFKLNDISVTVTQKVTPEIQYHTEEEIQNLVESGIKKYLEKANLLTTDISQYLQIRWRILISDMTLSSWTKTRC